MLNIRFSKSNVFERRYDITSEYIASTASSGTLQDFVQYPAIFPYYNKYLKNDPTYVSFTAASVSSDFCLYNRNQNYTSFLNPDVIKQLSSSYFDVQRTVTGDGYQYIGSSGWFFSFQRSFIIRTDVLSTTSMTASQGLSYYMSQQSYYSRVLDHQMNYSNDCTTRVDYGSSTATQFIKNALPYITTVALMDDSSNVLAIGKFSRPIHKLNFVPMSFKLRFFN